MTERDIQNREVSWKVLDIRVGGTITEPADGKVTSAVILVAGSGPTDRDWCSPLLPGTNGSAKLLAESLARRGFLTLRYDKLASGPHVRENLPRFSGKLSMQTHMDELAGAVDTARLEKNIDEGGLFALTNSEGAIHAVNYQLKTKSNRFMGLVLTGAPGRAIGTVGRGQILSQIRNLPGAEALMKPYDDAIAEFLAGKPMAIDPSLPEGLKLVLRSLENPNNLPFARELWNYSLPEYFARVEEPTLVVIGKKDIQIDWRIDGGALEEAVRGKASATFSYPDDANHVFKHEEKTLDALTADYISRQYNAAEAELDGEATGAIFDWLDRHRK